MGIFSDTYSDVERQFEERETELTIELANAEADEKNLKGRLMLEVSSLKGKLAPLKAALSDADKQIKAGVKDLSDFKEDVEAKAQKINADLNEFNQTIKGIFDKGWKHVEEIKELVTTMLGYSDKVFKAIQTLLTTLEQDLSNLINIQRLERLWKFVEKVIGKMETMCIAAFHFVEKVPAWSKAAYDELQKKLVGRSVLTYRDFTQKLGNIKTLVDNACSTHLPSGHPNILDTTVLSDVASFAQAIPNSIWTKFTHMLDLGFVNNFETHVSNWAEDVKSIPKKEYLIAYAEGLKSFLLITKSTFTIKVDGNLLDVLEAIISGGGDFGIPDVDAKVSPGTGLTLELDAYSVSGAVIGAIVLVIETTLAIVNLIGNL